MSRGPFLSVKSLYLQQKVVSMNNETLVLLEIPVGIQSTLGHLNLINNQGHHDGRGRWKKSILVKTGKLVFGRKIHRDTLLMIVRESLKTDHSK